jgi:hypothetical protein
MRRFLIPGTYVIDEDIQVSSGLVFAQGVTLIFQGGKIVKGNNSATDAITIYGNHTKIVAPITQIFGDDVNVEGTWDIERAYPQWFGAQAYDDIKDYSQANISVSDAAPFINKAIIMKQRGEVFLMKGNYVIMAPIIIPCGIQLVGERGMEPYTLNVYNGTILQSWRDASCGSICDESNKYMIYVNATAFGQKITQGGFLAGQITSIKNVELYNKIPSAVTGDIMNYTTACLRGIYAMGSLQLDHVRFYDFRNAVTFDKSCYIDNKRITNCDYVCHNRKYDVFHNNQKLFAFDLIQEGENLLFEHNAIHDGKYNKGVKTKLCGGGRISCNIINADVLIESCKSVEFSNNHIELGKTLDILSSNVTTRGNFFEIGTSPSVIIRGKPKNHDKCIVTMNNDAFLFYDFPRDYTESDLAGSELLYSWEQILKSFSERFDIVIDGDSILNIKNIYRQWMGEKLFGKLYMTGISMGKVLYNEDYTLSSLYEQVEDFNDFSYKLSNQCMITNKYQLESSFTIKNIKAPAVSLVMKNENVCWMEDSGFYQYCYQIIYDKSRKISSSLSTQPPTSQSNGFITYYIGPNQHSQDNAVDLVKYDGNNKIGVLIRLSNMIDFDGHFLLRLFRKGRIMTSSLTVFKYHYVDIPVCGSEFLYDNGISVNGFVWEEINVVDNTIDYGLAPFNSLVITGSNNIVRVDYKNGLAECRLDNTIASPTSSLWKRCDVLYKLGGSPSIEIISEDN